MADCRACLPACLPARPPAATASEKEDDEEEEGEGIGEPSFHCIACYLQHLSVSLNWHRRYA
eukprot:1466991-Prorocentrum_lima.AAC.1